MVFLLKSFGTLRRKIYSDETKIKMRPSANTSESTIKWNKAGREHNNQSILNDCDINV